jgi:hypothetical protein
VPNPERTRTDSRLEATKRRSTEPCGVVQLAALDLRRRPDHRAELTSQLLMGEVVRILERGPREWWRVRNEADGYAGWARSYGIRPASRARTRRWLELARGRVIVAFCEVRSAARGGHSLTPLFWNGRVIPGRRSGSRRRVELPDGRRGWVSTGALDTGGRRIEIMGRIGDLMGTPYLWGGRTPLGFDCSGLIQQLLSEQGIPLPRDAHDQFRATHTTIDPAKLGFGDLIFFGRGTSRMEHVGLMLGAGYYLHSRGAVRVNSIDPGNPFYDKALANQIRAFGRTKLSNKRPPRKGPGDLEPT